MKLLPKLALPVVVYDLYDDAYTIRLNQDVEKLFRSRSALIGVPGAFFPSTQFRLLPEYLTLKNELKALGKLTAIYVLSVNDPYVLQEFAEEIDAEEDFTYIADFEGKMAEALGALREFEGCGVRTKAFSCIVEQGAVSHLAVEDDWKVSKTSRAFNLLNRISPYIPYPGTIYDN